MSCCARRAAASWIVCVGEERRFRGSSRLPLLSSWGGLSFVLERCSEETRGRTSFIPLEI